MTAGSGSADPAALQAEIEATRAHLGRTVDELHARLDVPSRAREGVYRARDTAVETYRESPPAVMGAGLVLAGLVAGISMWRGKRTTWRRKR